MADYYPLLKRAIDGLATPSTEMRQAIYARARDALERQLSSFDPPLGEADLLRERLNLEDVFRRIESEVEAAVVPPIGPSPEPEDEPPSIPLARPPLPRSIPESATDDEARLPPGEDLSRPKVPTRSEGKPRNRKVMAFAAFGVLAILGMGLLAISNKTSTPKPAGSAPPVASDTQSDASKTENRLAQGEAPSGPATTKAAPPKAAPAQSASPAGADTAQSPNALPVVSRAFMVMEASRSSPNQFEGRASWSYAAEAGAGSGAKAIRAAIEFPTASITIDFSIAKNADAGVNASHIAMLVFEPKNPEEAVREMSAIEWRERENQTGSTFSGILVPVQDNVFMIGLDSGEFAVKRNTDLIRTQKWMVFEMRFANGRRGAVLVEKGSSGDKAVSAAFDDWK